MFDINEKHHLQTITELLYKTGDYINIEIEEEDEIISIIFIFEMIKS